MDVAPLRASVRLSIYDHLLLGCLRHRGGGDGGLDLDLGSRLMRVGERKVDVEVVRRGPPDAVHENRLRGRRSPHSLLRRCDCDRCRMFCFRCRLDWCPVHVCVLRTSMTDSELGLILGLCVYAE